MSASKFPQPLYLTKREYFAAMAMQALLAGDSMPVYTIGQISLELGIANHEYEAAEHWPLLVAKQSVKHADALLSALTSTEQR